MTTVQFTSMENRRFTWFNPINIFVVLMYARHHFASAQSTTTEVCSGDELDASCTPGTVLMIENAEYGRMQIGGKCGISSDGCSANVTSYVEQHCAARRRCKMPVSDDIRRWASDNQGCSRDQLGYLRVTYYCLPVYEGDEHQCRRAPLIVASSDTYLANIVTLKSRRGSASCPWLVRVSYGQTVNVTLFDFAAQKPTTQSTGGGQYAQCEVYARMYIGTAAAPTYICSGGPRQKVIYTNTGKQDVKIAIRSDYPSQQELYFLLHVQVSQTYGCAEYELVEDQLLVSQTNETVQLRCVDGANTARTWTLSCVDGQWRSGNGQTVDCRSNDLVTPPVTDLNATTGVGNQVLIFLAVALTVTLIIIAVGVVVYLRSKWRRHRMDSDRFYPGAYGTAAAFGLHTLPPDINGVDYFDATSVGGCSRARSQRDLCHPGTPQWPARARGCPPGTYVSTLEMRQNGPAPGGYVGYPHLQHAGGSQLTLPDVWATPCPVHGATGMYGRRYPVHHIYDKPLFDTEYDSEVMHTPGDSNPMSPFYHELDGLVLGVDGGPTPPPRPDGPLELPPGDHDPNSAPFSKI